MVPFWGTLGRSWDDPRTLGITRQDIVRYRLGFYRFFVDLGDPFREIFGYLRTEKPYFSTFISRLLFLMIWGSESGCLGWENQAFGRESIAKINSCRNWISHVSRVIFYDFGWSWDQFSWSLLPWRLAWNLMTLQGHPASTQILGTLLVEGNVAVFGLRF